MIDILIVGTGALATLFAARLARAGQDPTLLGTWPEGLNALRRGGARLVDSNGDEQAFSVRVAEHPADCRGAKYALVLVKSWQTERAACQLAECLAEDGLAVTLQNGLGNREILAKYLDNTFTTESTENTEKNQSKDSAVSHRRAAVARGTNGVHSVNSVVSPPRARGTNGVVKKPSRVALGTTTAGATLLGPGLVKTGGEGVVSIEAHPALGPLEEALGSANFKVEIVQDARSLMWGKLVINAAINPLTALLRVPNGELLERPAAHALLRALAEEAAAVASAEEVKLAFSDPAAMAEQVARKTATNHSSMLQDVRRGAPTEIDAICGAITRIGWQHNLPTPINQTCWQLVQALAQAPGDGAAGK